MNLHVPTVNLDNVMLYFIRVVAPLADKPYIVIYFHTLTDSNNIPEISWYKQVNHHQNNQ
jgi:hypothetical protein